MKIIKLTGNFLFLFIIVLVMCRCNEKDDQQDDPVYVLAVSELSATPGKNALQINWKAPEITGRLSYYLEWQGKNIDTTLHTTTTPNTNYTITRLYNDDYTVRVMAVSREQLYSQPVEVSGRPEPDNAAPEAVGNVETTPLVSGVTISWTKPTADDFEYVIAKVKKEGETNWFAIDTIQRADSLIFIEGLELMTSYNYSVQAFDYNGNASEEVNGSFKTREEIMLDNKLDANFGWEIADFSSQETKGDNGYASNAIDGKDNTFWHSVWNGGDFGEGTSSGNVPQYIVINLQQEVEPSAVLLYRRSGNAAGPILARIESTLQDPLRTNQWNDLGTYTLKGDTDNDALPCNFRVIRNAQYIKITILKAGSGNYALLREVDVKALVKEEGEEEY